MITNQFSIKTLLNNKKKEKMGYSTWLKKFWQAHRFITLDIFSGYAGVAQTADPAKNFALHSWRTQAQTYYMACNSKSVHKKKKRAKEIN